MTLLETIRYYIGTTYRRKLLDKHLNKNKKYFSGVVLDIGGGRKRGKFIPPKTEKWIFADITPELKPDVVCNVEDMQFDDENFDLIPLCQSLQSLESSLLFFAIAYNKSYRRFLLRHQGIVE